MGWLHLGGVESKPRDLGSDRGYRVARLGFGERDGNEKGRERKKRVVPRFLDRADMGRSSAAPLHDRG